MRSGKRLFSLAAVAATVGVLATAALAQAPQLSWAAKPTSSVEKPGQVDFTLTWRENENSRSSFGRTLPYSDLVGLTPATLGAPATTLLRFRLARDAGTFDCEGSAKGGWGSGTCEFRDSAAFAATLQQRGIGAPAPGQLRRLAMSDVGLEYLDELRRQRYATPDINLLVRAVDHGVNLKMLKGMDAAGYRVGDLPALIRLRDHGVSPRYVEELRAAGVRAASAEELVRMRDHGVSATYVKALKTAGYAGLTPERLIHLRDHGVTASYVEAVQSLGYRDLSPEELVRMRDRGVTAAFIARANLDGRLGVEELIRLRSTGRR